MRKFNILIILFSIILFSSFVSAIEHQQNESVDGTDGSMALGYNSDYSKTGVTYLANKTYLLETVTMKLKIYGVNARTLRMAIYNVNINNLPTGSAIAVSDPISTATLPSDIENFNISLNSNATIINGTRYAVILETVAGSWTTSNYVSFYRDTESATFNVAVYYPGNVWTNHSGTNPYLDLWGYNSTPSNISKFSITVINKWNNSAITNFSALINGTLYNTTNGTIITPIQTNNTELFNITFIKDNYFNLTYNNVNASVNITIQGELYQSIIIPNCFEKITNNSLTCSNNTFYPNAETLNLTISVDGYYDVTQEETIIALDNKTINFTDFYSTILTINSSSALGTVTTCSYTVTNLTYSFSEITSGTPSATINLINGTYNVTADCDGFAYSYQSVDINSTTQTLNFTLITTNSINFTFYDEKYPLVLFTNNVSFNLLNGGASTYNTSVGWKFLGNLTVGDYEIQYSSNGFDSRSYFFTITNKSTQNISLYLSNSTLTENYIIRVASLSDVNIPDAKVKLQKQFISLDGQYITIEECTTNTDGECDMFIEESSSINYKFIVIINDEVVKITDPLNIVNIPSEAKSIVLRVDTGESIYQSFQDAKNIFYSLTLVNNITTWDIIDSGNSITTFCLKISRKLYNQTSYTLMNNQCLSLTSGTLTKNISTYLINNSILFIEGQVVYNDGSKLTLDSIYQYTTYGFVGNNINKNDKLFFTIMLFMFVSLLTVLIPSMIIQIIINLSLLVIGEFINFSGLGKIIIINFLILGLIINYSRRNVSVTGV